MGTHEDLALMDESLKCTHTHTHTYMHCLYKMSFYLCVLHQSCPLLGHAQVTSDGLCVCVCVCVVCVCVLCVCVCVCVCVTVVRL